MEAITLPSKPSELIRVGIKDLKACEADPTYRINMMDWHRPSFDVPEICCVCMAGAVMAQTLSISPRVSVTPMSTSVFDAITQQRLDALNYMRRGRMDQAFEYLGVPLPDKIPVYVNITDYRIDQECFYADMESLAIRLEIQGH